MLFICSVVSHSLWPHGLQHARLLCPSPSPGVCLNSCPCHPTISSAVIPFSSCLQYFPSSRFFLVSWLFTSGGQGIGTSALASVLSMNIQDWFPLGLTGLIFLLSKGLSRVLSNTTVQKHQFYGAQPSLWSNSHNLYMTTRKTIALTIQAFVCNVVSLLFNMLAKVHSPFGRWLKKQWWEALWT